MKKFIFKLISIFFLIGIFGLPIAANAATTTVQVGFLSGFIGEYGNNAHQPEKIRTFQSTAFSSGKRINSATVSQVTDNGAFGGSQGNDYAVTLTFLFNDGTTQSFPAAVNWRDGNVEGIGFTVTSGVVDGTEYVLSASRSKTYLLQLTSSSRVYSDTAAGSQLGVVNGNAATSGALTALNAYRVASPTSPTPSLLTSTITAASNSIERNGTSTTLITVRLKDVNGNNLTTGGQTVVLSTTAGTLSSVTDNNNGTYTATLTSSAVAASTTITGTVGGSAIVDNEVVNFTVTPSAATSTITAASNSIVRNGTSTTLITVQLKNATGTNITTGGATVALSTTAGTLSSVTDNGNGTYTATLTSSTSAASTTITGTVGGSAITDNEIVNFTVAPSPANSTITAASNAIARDGVSTTLITVQLKDYSGANITTGGAAVALSTTKGSLSSVTDNGNGTYTATLTSSNSDPSTVISGTVNTSAITDTETVLFTTGAVVTGTVRRANGASVSGVTVKLYDNSAALVATTTTDVSGLYSFDGVAAGTYTVQFPSSGSNRVKGQSSTGTPNGYQVTSLTVAGSSNLSNIDGVVIDPSGVVYDSVQRAPVSGAVVSLYRGATLVSDSELDTSLGGSNGQTTDATGTYSFVLNATAVSGAYEIRVVAPANYHNSESIITPAAAALTPSLGGGYKRFRPNRPRRPLPSPQPTISLSISRLPAVRRRLRMA